MIEKIEFTKHPKPIYPSLFIIALKATGNQHLELYHTHNVAYEKVDAIEAAMRELANKQPELYQRGLTIGGWTVLHAVPVKADEIEQRFNELAQTQRKNEAQKVANEQNALLKEIIDTGNLTLFHQAIADGRINEYQKLYIHDILTEKGICKPLQ